MSKSIENSNAEVYSGTMLNATMIKQMLIENNIYAFIMNEYAGIASPYPLGNLTPVQVIVNAADLQLAMAYIKDFKVNYQEGQ